MIGPTASALVMVWSGALTDKWRVRILGPAILFGLACACVAMATNRWVWALPVVIFALRFFGQGMSSHIAVVAMARWFVATRGRALSVASLGFSVGEAILPLLFVALMTMIDWRLLWVAAAVVSVLGIPMLGWLLGKERTPGALAKTNSSLGMLGKHWVRKEALAHPLFWVLVLPIIGQSAFNTAFFFHQVHFAEIKGWSHVQLVSFFPFYTLISIGAMMLAGWALDRFGTARLMPFYQVPMIVAFLIFATASSPITLFIGLFFLGLSAGANATLPNAFWADFYGTAHIGAIKAMAAAVMVFGSAIGPGVTGLLIDFGFGLERQFVVIALYFALTTGLMIWGIRRAARDLPNHTNALKPE